MARARARYLRESAQSEGMNAKVGNELGVSLQWRGQKGGPVDLILSPSTAGVRDKLALLIMSKPSIFMQCLRKAVCTEAAQGSLHHCLFCRGPTRVGNTDPIRRTRERGEKKKKQV